jgi:hypothetical protein
MADTPQMAPQMLTSVHQLIEATKQQAIATLAAAIITQSERPWSIEQAMELANDIHMAMYPAPNYGHYQEWVKTKDARLKKVHGPAGP